jgi:hypothetical protein
MGLAESDQSHDRLFVLLAQTVAGRRRSREGGASSAGTPAPKISVARRLYWTLRHITAPLSAWADPIVEKVRPAQIATHGVFIFQK